VHALRKVGSFGYVNFDDERLLDMVDYDEILNCLDTLYGRPKHLLLDEIQNVNRWELWVNRLQRQGRQVIVTGSNSNLLSQELATHLTGRHVQTILFPFSFLERLKWMNRDLTQAEQKEVLAQYVEEGGFPEPLVRNLNRHEYLSSLLNSVIYSSLH
jgi:predicted AAA+ superfamily ATPase